MAAHWDAKLKAEAESKLSLLLLDISSLSITKPAKIWSMAGLNATETKKACIVNWMQLGVYRTREALHKMKKIKSKICSACPLNVVGSLEHYLLYCPFVQEIRERFVPQLFRSNPKVSSLLENEAALMVTILDPESALLPDNIRCSWDSSADIYALSRDYVYNVHNKFEKYYNKSPI